MIITGAAGGVIVNSSSINGPTKCAAVEYAKQNIRVNSVCPSPVEPQMMCSIEAGDDTDAAAAKNAFIDSIPVGRHAEPEEVAKGRHSS